jgi:hypothetical protein
MPRKNKLPAPYTPTPGEWGDAPVPELPPDIGDIYLDWCRSWVRELTRVTDNQCPGLRIIMRVGGACSFHAHFSIKGKGRAMINIGERPSMSILTARTVTRTIIELGRMGIDPRDGLEKRLVRELQEQGSNWRP